MDARSRKALGSLALIAYLGAYAALAATIGAALVPALPGWGELAFYATAGIVWIFPLKPLFSWMGRGG